MIKETVGAEAKLSEAIKNLMEISSLERITVTDIVKAAGVTRQTFYRHFKDKYDLVNCCFDTYASQCFNKMGVTLTLREGLMLKFDFIRKEKAFFSQAFRSKDYNSIEQHDYNFILQFYTNIIEKQLRTGVPRDVQFLLELYCHGSITMTVEWALSGMVLSSAEMADNLISALPPALANILLPVLR